MRQEIITNVGNWQEVYALSLGPSSMCPPAKNPKEYEAAVKQANKALESAEFRAWLAKHAEKGLEMAKDAGSAKALEFKFLLDALRRLQ